MTPITDISLSYPSHVSPATHSAPLQSANSTLKIAAGESPNLTLENLPPDVLALIFEAGCKKVQSHTRLNFSIDVEAPFLESRKFAITISHISRALRACALSTPLLWTTLSSTHTRRDELPQLVRRSGAMGLTLLLHVAHPSMPVEAFLTAIIDVASRWRSLFVTPHAPVGLACRLEKLNIDCFPLLEFVNDFHHCEDPLRLRTGGCGFPATRFSGWTAPRLTTFCANAFPPKNARHLTNIDVTLHAPNNLPGDAPLNMDFDMFFANLMSYAHLKVLKLIFCFLLFRQDWAVLVIPDQIPLLQLTELRFSTSDNSDCVWRCFSAFACPQLRLLDIDFPSKTLSVQEFTQFLSRFPRLETLSFNIGCDSPVALSRFPQFFPYLRYLRLTTLLQFQHEDPRTMGLLSRVNVLALRAPTTYPEAYFTTLYKSLFSKENNMSYLYISCVDEAQKAELCQILGEYISANPLTLRVNVW